MGQGINLAAVDNPEAAAAIDNMKDQLLIALIKRAGVSWKFLARKLTTPRRTYC